MRLYSFVNMYLSPLQHGLQTAHTVSELFVKCPQNQLLKEWAHKHKTIIILNGGYSKNLYELERLFNSVDSYGYPWVSFNEEFDALEGARTAVSIVLTPKIYETSAKMMTIKNLLEKLTDEEIQAVLNYKPYHQISHIAAGSTLEIMLKLINTFQHNFDDFTIQETRLCLELTKYRLA